MSFLGGKPVKVDVGHPTAGSQEITKGIVEVFGDDHLVGDSQPTPSMLAGRRNEEIRTTGLAIIPQKMP